MATDKRTDACFRLLCYTLIFLAYKKWQKHEKNSPQKRFFLPFFFATCQCGCYNVFKNFLPTKLLSKVAHNWPKHFISQSSPAHSPELIFHIIKCREQASVLLSVLGSKGTHWMQHRNQHQCQENTVWVSVQNKPKNRLWRKRYAHIIILIDFCWFV